MLEGSSIAARSIGLILSGYKVLHFGREITGWSLKETTRDRKEKIRKLHSSGLKKKKYCLDSYKRPNLATIHEKKDLGISFVTSSKWVSLKSVEKKKANEILNCINKVYCSDKERQ